MYKYGIGIVNYSQEKIIEVLKEYCNFLITYRIEYSIMITYPKSQGLYELPNPNDQSSEFNNLFYFLFIKQFFKPRISYWYNQ